MTKRPIEVLTPEEARTLIRAPSSRAPTGIRNRALLTVMYRGGLRIAEALGLEPRDIDPDAGTIRVRVGKGAKARTVALDDGAMAVLVRWLDTRRALGINGRGRHPVFATITDGAGGLRKGSPLHGQYVREMVKRMAARAGIDKRVTPHTLRHTHAAELMAEGVPVNVIQQQLGHSNLATTSLYLDHIAPAERVARLRGREWSI